MFIPVGIGLANARGYVLIDVGNKGLRIFTEVLAQVRFESGEASLFPCRSDARCPSFARCLSG